jgi:hypothetical protein
MWAVEQPGGGFRLLRWIANRPEPSAPDARNR